MSLRRRRTLPFLSLPRLAADLTLITFAALLAVAALTWTGLFDAVESWLVMVRLNWHTWGYHPGSAGAHSDSPFPEIAVLHFDSDDLLPAGADAVTHGVSPEAVSGWHEREQLQWMVMRSLEILADLKLAQPDFAPPAIGLDFYNLDRSDPTNAEILAGIDAAAAELGNVVDGYRVSDQSRDSVLPAAAEHGFIDLLRPTERLLTFDEALQVTLRRQRDFKSTVFDDSFALAVFHLLRPDARIPGFWIRPRLAPARQVLFIQFLPPRPSVSTAQGLAPARSAFPVIHFRDLIALDDLLAAGHDAAEWPPLGKIYRRALMVGVDVPNIDRIETPYSNRLYGSQLFPGVEAHANILYNLLNGVWLTRFSWRFPLLSWLLLFGLMWGSAWSAGRLAFGWSVAAGLASLGILVGIDAVLWQRALMWLPLAQWLTGIALANRLAAQILARRERRAHALVAQRLAQHVTEKVAQQLIHDPQAGELGAQPREVTVLFSDLEGFTTLTERLPAEEMLALMNRYLDAMSREIAEEGGTLANYIGDAIFAIFGAPGPLPDHARRGVNAALRMQRALGDLNAQLAGEGRGPLAQRIGLSTGRVLIGNVGGSDRFIWTAMGDAVPIGARLEPLNKKYGTRILMTKATCEQLGEGYNVQLVEAGIRVRGREGLLDVYTVSEEGIPCSEAS
jgi:class 3 adenylate cyclase